MKRENIDSAIMEKMLKFQRYCDKLQKQFGDREQYADFEKQAQIMDELSTIAASIEHIYELF